MRVMACILLRERSKWCAQPQHACKPCLGRPGQSKAHMSLAPRPPTPSASTPRRHPGAGALDGGPHGHPPAHHPAAGAGGRGAPQATGLIPAVEIFSSRVHEYPCLGLSIRTRSRDRRLRPADHPASPSSQPNTTPGPACPRCITAPARQPQSDFTTIPTACLPPQPVAPGITPPARAPSAMFYLKYHDHAMSARFSPDPSRAMRDAPPRSCGDPPCNRHADCWMELR